METIKDILDELNKFSSVFAKQNQVFDAMEKIIEEEKAHARSVAGVGVE